MECKLDLSEEEWIVLTRSRENLDWQKQNKQKPAGCVTGVSIARSFVCVRMKDRWVYLTSPPPALLKLALYDKYNDILKLINFWHFSLSITQTFLFQMGTALPEKKVMEIKARFEYLWNIYVPAFHDSIVAGMFIRMEDFGGCFD